MGYKNPAGEATRLTPPEARLFEYGSRGPEAGSAEVDRWLLTEAERASFTRDAVLNGWS